MGGPGKGPGKAPEKAKDFKGTTKKLIKDYLSKYKVALFIVIIFAIGSTIFSIVGPKILGNATTEIFNGLRSRSANCRIPFCAISHIGLGIVAVRHKPGRHKQQIR